MSVPGVGPITVLSVASAFDDARRFRRSSSAGAYLGLTPTRLTTAIRELQRRKTTGAAGIAEEIGCHTFRATGITAYLANGGALEHAQEMAAHESPRTTKLYDRTKE